MAQVSLIPDSRNKLTICAGNAEVAAINNTTKQLNCQNTGLRMNCQIDRCGSAVLKAMCFSSASKWSLFLSKLSDFDFAPRNK